ncbi:phage terminase small subunit P27 family [Companilactobacillus zhongbaensis]|uniref:phage terminase small subunit P27 family n=1 Tax=Companilactobacillus zhongbaensis TaxID=2486009 RepID=UPI000F77490D|nr:phage terminase small subunit P27 family [Companilactobacillus zhongbaensis]
MASGGKPKLTGYTGDSTKETQAEKKQAEKQLFTYEQLNSTPPTWLKGTARSEWNRLVPLLKKDSAISELDRNTLISYCNTSALIIDCQKEINKAGAFTDDGKKTNFLITQQQAQRDLKGFATSLGLTIESRVKLEYSKAKNTTPDDKFKELLA